MSGRKIQAAGGAVALALVGLCCAHTSAVAPAKDQPDQASAPDGGKPKAHRIVAAPPAPGHPALTALPGGEFKPGAVAQIQAALKTQGYDQPESGVLDAATQDRLAAFQKQRELPSTGFPDDATLRALGLDPTNLARTSP